MLTVLKVAKLCYTNYDKIRIVVWCVDYRRALLEAIIMLFWLKIIITNSNKGCWLSYCCYKIKNWIWVHPVKSVSFLLALLFWFRCWGFWGFWMMANKPSVSHIIFTFHTHVCWVWVYIFVIPHRHIQMHFLTSKAQLVVVNGFYRHHIVVT